MLSVNKITPLNYLFFFFHFNPVKCEYEDIDPLTLRVNDFLTIAWLGVLEVTIESTSS